MLQILKKKKEWQQLVDSMMDSDFYHTYDYHNMTKSDGQKSVLLKYVEGDKMIALPLLLRKIEDTLYFDATSVYGYSGPLSHKIGKGFDTAQFQKSLQQFFESENIISAFSRLNPYIPHQEFCLKNIGEVTTLGTIVNIDLTKSLDEQRQEYQRRLKTYVNKSRRLYTVKKAKTQEDVLKFIRIYYENMWRVNAKEDYYFGEDYFFDLLNCSDFKTMILLASHQETEEIIGGAMFTIMNNVVQYHLSGAKEEYLKLNPIKLLIDEMRIYATNENYTYFNLGGGVGNKEDSLFNFKSGFSNDYRTFKLWRYIVNEPVYERMVWNRQREECARTYKQCMKFFPCYRCNLQNNH